MPVAAAIRDHRGFTTTVFGRCAQCERELKPDHLTCACGAHILYMRQQPKQKQLTDMVLSFGEDVPVRIGYGGSRGASKSRTIRDLALVVASELGRTLPGIVIYIIRSVWGDVYQNHVTKLDLERPELTKFYNGGAKEYNFPDAMGGPRIVFGYGDTSNDIRRVARGPEAFLMLIDQCEAFTEDQLAELNTPNRWPAAGKGGPKTVYGFNPGGPGSRWLKRVFVDRNFKERERPQDYEFIQGYGYDNFDAWFSMEDIEIDGRPLDFDTFYQLPGELPPCPNNKFDNEWLRSMPPNHRFRLFVEQTTEGRKMWSKPDSIRMGDLFGRFDVFTGQYFAGIWNRDKVVLA